jgi:hypothetical protein
MRAQKIVARLEGFSRRGPGTDAERRAANWLTGELEQAGREVRIEPFWCRPNWALAHAWHTTLAIAGSLASVSDAGVGMALLGVALLSIAADALFGVSLGRRLTRERASQNVVARPRPWTDRAQKALDLVVTANYDAGRTGLAYRDRVRSASAWLRGATSNTSPGWLGWLCIGIAWLLAVAILRSKGDDSTALAVAQFLPTALLVLVVAALFELATADYGPAANDNGSGVALAVALIRALDAAPPRHMDVHLVLQGAGEGGGIGLRKHLRRRPQPNPAARSAGIRRKRRKRKLDRTNAAVIALGACGRGQPRYWTSDGSLLPVRYSRRLRQLCGQIAADGRALPYRGRGDMPALPARIAGIPAIALGCLDGRGLVPRSHQPDDHADSVDQAALDATLEFALILVDALDSFLAQAQGQTPAHTETDSPAGAPASAALSQTPHAV